VNTFFNTSDLNLAGEHGTKDMKVSYIILDGVRDHIIPHISRKDTGRQMWVDLTDIYQSTNENKKMVLWEKLNNVKMNKYETVTSYLMTVQQDRDELAGVKEIVNDSELVKVFL